MPSTNKTTNYQLSKYLGTDKPTYLGDYNSDMEKIDNALKNNNDLCIDTKTIAETAQSTADTAKSKAEVADSKAGLAQSTAENAVASASNAQSTANSASTIAGQASNDIIKLKNQNIISGEEFETNEMIDGKRVYLKRFKNITMPNAGSISTPTGLSNITLVDIFGNAHRNSDGYNPPLPAILSQTAFMGLAHNTSVNSFTITTTENRSDMLATVYLKYIKN